jgi:hypothetical protein
MCRSFALHAGSGDVEADFWLLEAPTSLAAQSEVNADGFGTGAAAGYGYRQLFYEPFLGGGILTALSVPIILSIGSLTFAIASAAVAAGLIRWGLVRNRRP